MTQEDNALFTGTALAEIATLLTQVRDAVVLAGIATADPGSEEGLRAQSMLQQLAKKYRLF
jgi:hypothetical protein